VLFADLRGSLELLANRDPEPARHAWREMLRDVAFGCRKSRMSRERHHGIMALFGAPVAHEDHATRACYAALRMQESVKRFAQEVRRTHADGVKIRVGLNSGEVAVRAIAATFIWTTQPSARRPISPHAWSR
jgi:class 3 adenylate cyclase